MTTIVSPSTRVILPSVHKSRARSSLVMIVITTFLPALAQASHLQHWLFPGALRTAFSRLQLPAGHQIGQPLAIKLRGRVRDDLPAIPEDRHSLRNRKHLVQFVADEQGGDPGSLQVQEHQKQGFHFPAGETVVGSSRGSST